VNDWLHALGLDGIDDATGVVAGVADERSTASVREQFLSDGGLVSLAGR
jgi:hypothetical protein